MAYSTISPVVGAQPIATTDTVQRHPLGMIVQAVDPTYGVGEFIYLLGVGSTVVGTPVTYNTTGWQTALGPVGSNKPEPIAFAMSANVASSYGWYQIGGRAIAKKTSGGALGANAAVGIKTSALVSASGSGKEILGALTIGVSTASSTVSLIIDRPCYQGRIT